jgi:hypothetical protein
VFGRVRSKPPRHAGTPGDPDRDGISDPLDIDDDGDLILDNIDSSNAAGASQFDGEFMIHSLFSAGQFDQIANANAGGLTTEQVDAALSRVGSLKLEFVPGDSAELDCGSPQSRTDPNVGGLVYCSRGGTGKVAPPSSQPFPGCCDPDGDGFGTFQPQPGLQGGPMVLNHGATTAQIGTGDVLIERLTTGGVETQLPASVQYIFATVPALVSYNDGQGNSATLSYPVTAGTFFPVAAGPNGDAVATLTLWRPQRRPIAGEACLGNTPPCEWIDMGHLEYGVQSAGKGGCPQNTLSESDPNLKKGSSGNFGPNSGGFTDLASDQPASSANTLTYTLNLTRCLAALGLSFNPGEVQKFALVGGTSSGDEASEAVVFKRL